MVCPPTIRYALTSMYLFNVMKAEWDKIKKENLYFLPKGFDYFLRAIYKDPYSFLFIKL